MAKKLPKILRKEYKDKRYRRRILSRVHTEKGRKLLAEHFAQGDDGVHRPAAPVEEDRIKELSRLAKEIKKNRSAVRKGRIILVVLVVGGIVAFNLLFKNMLLERAAERGLEEAFRARAEIDSLRFSAFQGTLTMDSLRVADRREPMENLFELGPIAFRMLPVELLKGNVVIQEISGEALQFGTPRETSGALLRFAEDPKGVPGGGPGSATGGSAEGSMAAGGAGGLLSGGVLDLPDPRELVTEFVAASESLATIEGLRQQAEEAQGAWETRLAGLQEGAENAADRAAELQEINPGEIDSVDQALSARETVEAARESIRDATQDIRAAGRGAREDLAAVEDIDNALRSAVEDDIDSLLSRLPGFDGGVEGLVAGLIQGYLQERLGNLYGYGQRGLAIYERLQADSNDEPPAGAGRRGTVVSFPSASYPRFYLGIARASVGNPEEGDFGEGSIEYISSDPDMVEEAPRLTYGDRRGGRELAVEAILPAVQSGEELAQVSISLAGVSTALPGDLSQGVFDRLSAESDAAIEFQLGRQGRGRGSIDLLLRETALDGPLPEDPIRSALRQALADTDSISFAGEFSFEDGRLVALDGSSNLGQILADSVARLLEERRQVYEARLREELNNALQERLATLREEQGELAAVVDDVQALVDRSESWNQVLAETEAEVERRLQALQDQAQEEVERRGQDALDNIRRRF